MKNEFDQNRKIFTSESVTEGHPDKVCDQIGDAILDDILAQDPNARVACEVCATTGLVLVMGEITTTGYCDVQKIVRKTVEEIGYNRGKFGFDAENLAVLVSLNEQSPDIALGVDIGGAGDQGIMFGYACNETENYMPYAIYIAHELAKRLTKVRKENTIPYLRPDGKTQVTVEYENNKPKRIETILISTQHKAEVDIETLRKDVTENVIKAIVPSCMIDEKTKIYINPTGRFVIGGPLGDTGLTGRKIIVDTYGGYSRHGGGAFSGKDASKVDRSATYMLRHIAKNIVANNLARKCEIEVSYAIGMKEPLSICVNTFGTGMISEDKICDIIKNNFDLTPAGIIEYLDLKKPIYTKTTNYGHFGKDELTWEKVIKLN